MPQAVTISSDSALIADMLTGDVDAQRRFVSEFDGFIRGVIFSLGNDTYIYLDDLTQDMYEFLARENFRVLRNWRKDAQLRTYLYTIIRRQALRRLRQYRVNTPETNNMCPDQEHATPETYANMTELRKCIGRTMAQIHESYRDIIHLRYYQECSYQEISSHREITTNNVGVRLSRAEAKFKEKFREICPDHYFDLFPMHSDTVGN